MFYKTCRSRSGMMIKKMENTKKILKDQILMGKHHIINKLKKTIIIILWPRNKKLIQIKKALNIIIT